MQMIATTASEMVNCSIFCIKCEYSFISDELKVSWYIVHSFTSQHSNLLVFLFLQKI